MTREEFISKVCDLWVEGFDLLQSKVSDTNPTEEKMELLHASLKDKGKDYVTQWVKDYVLKHLDDDSIYSIIKRHTGEPKENGIYLITTIGGIVRTAYWNIDCWLINDLPFSTLKVKAWYKLSDIESYKEE